MKQGWFLGAYAANASLNDASAETEDRWWNGLRELPFVRGLELPFYADLHAQDPRLHIKRMPLDWEYVVTPLPGTMNLLQQHPSIGLASKDRAMRKVALDRYQLVRERIDQIHQRASRALVKAVQIHSAPTRPHSDPSAFLGSLEILLESDFGGAELWIEHCDAYSANRVFSKGFLSLREEIGVYERISHPRVKFALNWGRSAMEQRDPEGPLMQVEELGEKLAAFLFSGTSDQDPLYGEWQDNHAPLATGSKRPWEPTAGLLTVPRVKEVLRALPPETQLGIKVQPAPASLTLEQRLDFLKRQLTAFEEARLGV